MSHLNKCLLLINGHRHQPCVRTLFHGFITEQNVELCGGFAAWLYLGKVLDLGNSNTRLHFQFEQCLGKYYDLFHLSVFISQKMVNVEVGKLFVAIIVHILRLKI